MKRVNKLSIQKYLGVPKSWPIKEDIKHRIVVMPNAADVKAADRHDPCGCALSKAACRLFDVPAAAIGGRIAYIPQRDANGKPYIARVRAASATRVAIRRFDQTGTMPKYGFVFVPLAPSDLIKYKRTYMRKWGKGEVGHNQMAGRKMGARRFRCLPTNVGGA